MPTIKFDDVLKQELKDPEFKKEFEKGNSELQSAVAVLKAREQAGLTQRQLAEKAKIPQSTVARIERGDNTSIGTMSKIASALGKKLTIAIS